MLLPAVVVTALVLLCLGIADVLSVGWVAFALACAVLIGAYWALVSPVRVSVRGDVAMLTFLGRRPQPLRLTSIERVARWPLGGFFIYRIHGRPLILPAPVIRARGLADEFARNGVEVGWWA